MPKRLRLFPACLAMCLINCIVVWRSRISMFCSSSGKHWRRTPLVFAARKGIRNGNGFCTIFMTRSPTSNIMSCSWRIKNRISSKNHTGECDFLSLEFSLMPQTLTTETLSHGVHKFFLCVFVSPWFNEQLIGIPVHLYKSSMLLLDVRSGRTSCRSRP